MAHCKPRKAFSKGLDQSQPQGTTTVGKEVRNSPMVMVFSKDEQVEENLDSNIHQSSEARRYRAVSAHKNCLFSKNNETIADSQKGIHWGS